jgi:hypothetical protein
MLDGHHNAIPRRCWRAATLGAVILASGVPGFLSVPRAAADPPQRDAQDRCWVIMVECRMPSTPPSPAIRYELTVYEVTARASHRLLDRKPLEAQAVAPHVGTIWEHADRLLADDQDPDRAVGTNSPTIRLLMSKRSENRRLDMCFDVANAHRLGVRDEVRQLLAVANGCLAAVGQRIPAHPLPDK